MTETAFEIERQKIRDYLIPARPVHISEFMELFFRIYVIEDGIDLDNYLSVIRDLGLKVHVMEIGYDVDKSALQTMLQRRLADFEVGTDYENAESRFPNFRTSDEYIFVKQFARKYGENATNEEVQKLNQLLEARGWILPTDSLQFFVDDAIRSQELEDLKARVLYANPQTLDDVLVSYLNHCRSDDLETLPILVDVLLSKGFSFESPDDLKSVLAKIEREIELKNFEKSLASENVWFSIDEVDCLSGYEFEGFLRDLFQKMGYQVEQTKLSADQGADLVVIKFGERKVIQAKRYSGKVGNYAVQEVLAAIALYRASLGMVITNSYFTPAAVELAVANRIELVDRDSLSNLIRSYW